MGFKTILYDSHVAHGARMIEFGGWDMPVQYEGVLGEHLRVRSDVGMFDTSHMGAFWIDGQASLDTLSRIVTQDLRTLAVGRCRYGFMLNEAGGVIDDLIAYRMDEHQWMLVVNAGTAPGDFAWLQQQGAGTECQIRKLREYQSKLDIQGPNTLATLKRVFDIEASELKRFGWLRTTVAGKEWVISRTGYTGEDGVEIYASTAAIRHAWQTLLDAGIRPCGLGARDTLRLEAGFPLYGHEFDSETSPAEAGMMRYCSKPEPFIGREALLQRAANPQRVLVPFYLAGRQTARHSQIVQCDDGTAIGRVTSGSYGPTVRQAIGFAYIKPSHAHPGSRLLVDTGRARLPITITELPFLKGKQ